MESKEFAGLRKKIEKTQKELAILLGVSSKAIGSYEQGWRSIPHHIERQLLYLVCQAKHKNTPHQNCWDILDCPKDKREKCPSWEFKSGTHCWMINGTVCQGSPQKSWAEKITLCKECEVFKENLE